MTKVVTQGMNGQEEFSFGADPLALVLAQSSAGDQIMNMGVIDQGAAPGVEDAEHGQGGTHPFWVVRQILQGLGAGLEQELVADLGMRAHPSAQWLRQGESHQEIGGRQQQA